MQRRYSPGMRRCAPGNVISSTNACNRCRVLGRAPTKSGQRGLDLRGDRLVRRLLRHERSGASSWNRRRQPVREFIHGVGGRNSQTPHQGVHPRRHRQTSRRQRHHSPLGTGGAFRVATLRFPAGASESEDFEVDRKLVAGAQQIRGSDGQTSGVPAGVESGRVHRDLDADKPACGHFPFDGFD